MGADQLAGFSEDMRKKYSAMVYNENAKEMVPAFVKDTLPMYFKMLENRLSSQGAFYGGGKHFVGNKWTYADVLLFDIIENYILVANSLKTMDDVMEKYPMLGGFVEHVRRHKALKKYFKSSRRPINPNGKSAFLLN